MSKGPVHRIRVRAVVAYPAISFVLVAAVAVALTPFGPSQVVALAAEVTPTATTTVTTTAEPSVTTTAEPSVTTTAEPSVTTTAEPSVTTTAVPTPSPSPGAVAAAVGLPVDHHMLARIEGSEFQASYLPVDAAVTDASQFQTYRVRFKFHNDGTSPETVTPRLEYHPDGGTGYVVVPDKPTVGVPLHVAREWVPSLGLSGGTMQGPLGEDIAVGDFLTGNEGGGLAVSGHRSMGANPDQSITLEPGSYTEQEFTVTLSVDAPYLTGYQLRITDAGAALTGTQVARIRLGAAPALQLSPGQRQGVAVVDPIATSAAGSAYPLQPAASTIAKITSGAAVSAVPAVYRPNTVGYPLIASTLSAATAVPSDIHGPYSVTADQCAVCHRAHAAKTPELLVNASQSSLCFTCHDNLGSGALTDVQTDYDLARPANNNDTREYYSHDAVSLTPSTTRPSECGDCHNSHKARPTPDSSPALNGTGWQASGRLEGVSGVSVLNGPAGSAPRYTALDGEVDKVTREYQLCFKCHSGSATLLPPIAGKPSKDALDKGVEFNPENASFHPVEAKGKNQTTKMSASLAGTSPYKLWNFTIGSTVRCLNCHASGTTPDTTPTPLPLPGSVLAPHTSTNRGILLKNYKDRVLKTTDEIYSAGDFALCYVCHGEAPFAPDGSASGATDFSLHSKHLTGIAGKGDGVTDIDTAGAGQGNAICAECHFRIHSTTNKVGSQVIPGSRLVNFAPNVLPVSGTEPISWTPGATGSGSCALICHGKVHNPFPYGP